jgi:hypothetical protein
MAEEQAGRESSGGGERWMYILEEGRETEREIVLFIPLEQIGPRLVGSRV